MPINVLITGANSTVAHSIIKALRGSTLDVRLLGCDINPFSPGLYRADQAFLVKPYLDPDYEAIMLAILKEQRVDVMMLAVESELQFMADRRARWEAETGTRIIVNRRELLDVTQDKYRTATFLAANGCSAPASTTDTDPEALADFVAQIGFPVLIKPRRGSCSRHVHVVENIESLLACLPSVPDPVIQEYLGSPEEEYTCGVFVDARGALKGIATLKRTLASGITQCAVLDHFPDVEDEVRRIVQALRPIASCNIQLRRNRNGRPTAFEINARFSSSVAIRAHFGFNEAEATLRSYYLGEDVPMLTCRPGVAMRYVNEVYAEPDQIQSLMASGQHRPTTAVEANF